MELYVRKDRPGFCLAQRCTRQIEWSWEENRAWFFGKRTVRRFLTIESGQWLVMPIIVQTTPGIILSAPQIGYMSDETFRTIYESYDD